jgi:DnaD/phage-associated family protein
VNSFSGFSSDTDRKTSIPNAFFSELLPIIDHLGELKVTLFALWFLEQQEGNLLFIRYQHFINDNHLLNGLGHTHEESLEALRAGLIRASERGTFLQYQPQGTCFEEALFFINTPRGRATYRALQQGAWSPEEQGEAIRNPQPERPNIFKLYEANIGPLTPIMAETLQEAEESYPPNWIEQAIRIAVENNVRRWRYVQAILDSWKERGRDEKDRRDAQEDSRRFLDGEFGKFFKHE